MSATGNKNVVLVTGSPSTGKTTSLMSMANQERIAYLNSDLKELPFKSKFQEISIVDPKVVLQAIQEIESNPNIDSAVLDTLTCLMNSFEKNYVMTHRNQKGVLDSMGGWSEYANFYAQVMQGIKGGTKNYAVMAHASDTLNEKDMVIETKIPVKGAVGRVGVEADFTTIVATKRIPLDVLKEWENPLLTITDLDIDNGFKYVFQTRIDASTIGERIRSAIGLWDTKEKFINNDLSAVFKRLNEYYS